MADEPKDKIECFRDPRTGKVEIGFASEVAFAPGGRIEVTPDDPAPGSVRFMIHLGPADEDRKYGIIVNYALPKVV